MRYRLPETGRTLAEGFIDLDRMMMAVGRTDLVGHPEVVGLDRELAVEIFHRGPMSTQRFQTLIDRLIHRFDPDAIGRRAARTSDDRNITIGPDRFTTGQARISGSLPSEQAAIINARLDAMATEVHKGDGRTLKQRRADAYVALAQGRQHLVCGCDDCTAARTAARPDGRDTSAGDSDPGPIDASSSQVAVQPGLGEFAADGSAPALGTDDGAGPDPSAGQPDSAATDGVGTANSGHGDTDPAAAQPDSEPGASSAACNHPTTPYMYVVVNLSTLLGLDEDPAYLDGQGLIGADVARSLLAEAKRAYVTPPPENPAVAAERYRPSRKLRALLRAGELCCQFPGCNNPVAYTDLDHHHAHGDGGPTNPRNMGPLCRFHHRIKTFSPWRQYQDLWRKTVFTSPEGFRYVGNAFNGLDLFDAIVGGPRGRAPDHPTRSRFDQNRDAARVKQIQQQRDWELRNPPPF